MFESNFLTFKGMAEKLNIRESTVRYWQEQYDPWIPCSGGGKEKWYPLEAVQVFRFIMESADAGMEPQDIETALIQKYRQIAAGQDTPESATSPGNNGSVIESLLGQLTEQQKRIANAQERRAEAEEKKANAFEKRADAQLLMAEAVNAIAKEMSGLFAKERMPFPDDIFGKFGKKQRYDEDDLTAAEMGNDLDVPMKISPGDEGMSAAGDLDPDQMEMDDLSDLIDDIAEETFTGMDDLSDLVDGPDEVDDLSELIDSAGEETTAAPDDLSELVDTPEELTADELNDLNDLIDSAGEETAAVLDDLSELVDTSEELTADELDDLSELVDGPLEAQTDAMDDLDALIDSAADEISDEMDDLNDLIDGPEEKAADELDDLNDLLEPSAEKEEPKTAPPMPEEAGTSKQESPPAQKKKLTAIPDDHKSKMIAIIIAMKEKQGLSVEETAEKLNAKGYKPISGKEKWDTAAISQIYSHIDMVRTSREGGQ